MLRIESLSYEVNSRPLLKDISFNVHQGEMIAILGANGAGKSTLMKLLSGEKKASSGSISINGKTLDSYTKKQLASKRAMLHQHNTISMAFTVEEVVMMGRYGQYGSKPLPKDVIALEETMEICGIKELAERSMLSLSGGEQQRVHLARVLAQLWDINNGLLLMDEPISSMDIQYQHQTLAIAAALAERGFAVITVLHDINLAAQYASRILMLKGGRKWWDGNPTEVLTTSHIYNIFGIQAYAYTDHESLKTQVNARAISLDAAQFNSNMKHLSPVSSAGSRTSLHSEEYHNTF